MNFNRKLGVTERILLCVLAVIVLAACYYFLVQTPVGNAMSAAREEKAALEDELLILETKLMMQNDMQASLDELGGIYTIETPEYDNLRRLMVYLNSVFCSAEEFELEFEGTSIDETSAIVRREADMTFRAANYSVAKRIITSLQTCPYRCVISDMQLLSEKDTQEKNYNLTNGEVWVTLSVTFFERLP